MAWFYQVAKSNDGRNNWAIAGKRAEAVKRLIHSAPLNGHDVYVYLRASRYSLRQQKEVAIHTKKYADRHMDQRSSLIVRLLSGVSVVAVI
jgi:hypothetical protein